MEIIAKLRHLHITPRKARFVADLLKGLRVDEAEAQLMLSSRRPSAPILKLLQSAIANAKHNYQLDKEKLFVKSVNVDGGPMSKRWTPRARGSASQIQKKTSHITMILGMMEEVKKSKFNIKKKEKKPEKNKQKTVKNKDNKPQIGEEKLEKIGGKEQPKFFQKVFRRKSV